MGDDEAATTFFDLPLELRELVHRRRRFLQARDALAARLEGRPPPLVWDLNEGDGAWIEVAFSPLSPAKRMRLCRVVRGAYNFLDEWIDVVDEDRGVRVSLLPTRREGGVQLLLGTQARSTRSRNLDRDTWWWRNGDEFMPMLTVLPLL